jgi:hypothetical protein
MFLLKRQLVKYLSLEPPAADEQPVAWFLSNAQFSKLNLPQFSVATPPFSPVVYPFLIVKFFSVVVDPDQPNTRSTRLARPASRTTLSRVFAGSPCIVILRPHTPFETLNFADECIFAISVRSYVPSAIVTTASPEARDAELSAFVSSSSVEAVYSVAPNDTDEKAKISNATPPALILVVISVTSM